MIFERLVDKNSNLVVYDSTRENIQHVFGRQAISMVWDYTEINPFTDAGWKNMQDWVERVIDHCSQISPVAGKQWSGIVTQSSATSLPHSDNFFDAVFTDPPYYDNVSYALLSDFFYVWLKRTLGNLYPDLFTTVLTPKSNEIIADKYRWKSQDKAKEYYEEMLRQAFKEIHRVLRPGGIVVVVFAHKSTAGWETLMNSLLDSRLVVTAAWPIHTEMRTRLGAKQSAALASSIYMIARKIPRESVGFYKDARDSLKAHLANKLDRLWKEGISGADFFIAAIGSSIEVFGKYDKIIDDEGNTIRADRFLEDIRRIATDYAVRQVLHNGFVEEITPMTRFYVLWRWAYGEARLDFDDAHKLAQGVGIALDQEWHRGFIRKDKELVDILGPEDRELDELEGSNELIDVLHRVLLLWKSSKSDELLTLLSDTGFGKSDTFYKVAQALAESLPSNSKEKKLLEGFLQGRQ